MNHSEQINELTKALIEAEKSYGKIAFNKTAQAGSFKFHYADLTEIYNATKPALREHGLKCVGYFNQNGDGINMLTIMLMHVSGQWMKSEIKVSPQTSKPTDLGSFITYMRRYLYVTLLGISTDEEVEGDALNNSCEDKNALSDEEKAELKKKLKGLSIIKRKLEDRFEVDDITKVKRKDYDVIISYLDKREQNNVGS